jgi:dihydroneopterin triphosphate diphosphatase
MPRALFQVIVIPYRRNDAGILKYALFRRIDRDGGYWQTIAGGGEEGESPLEAARREALEEAGLPVSLTFIELDSRASIPISHFKELSKLPGIYVIPEYAFAVDAKDVEIQLSYEHSEFLWLRYDKAMEFLRWDSNKTALWELNERLTKG